MAIRSLSDDPFLSFGVVVFSFRALGGRYDGAGDRVDAGELCLSAKKADASLVGGAGLADLFDVLFCKTVSQAGARERRADVVCCGRMVVRPTVRAPGSRGGWRCAAT